MDKDCLQKENFAAFFPEPRGSSCPACSPAKFKAMLLLGDTRESDGWPRSLPAKPRSREVAGPTRLSANPRAPLSRPADLSPSAVPSQCRGRKMQPACLARRCLSSSWRLFLFCSSRAAWLGLRAQTCLCMASDHTHGIFAGKQNCAKSCLCCCCCSLLVPCAKSFLCFCYCSLLLTHARPEEASSRFVEVFVCVACLSDLFVKYFSAWTVSHVLGSEGFDSLQCMLATSDQANVFRCQTGMCT